MENLLIVDSVASIRATIVQKIGNISTIQAVSLNTTMRATNCVTGFGSETNVTLQTHALAVQGSRRVFVHPEDVLLEEIIRFVAMVSPPCLVQEDNTPVRVEEQPPS